MDNENTPLLQKQNGSASSSNANDGSNAERQGNIFSKTLSDVGLLKRREDKQPYSPIPDDSTISVERNEAWVKDQKEFISRSGRKASLKKRVAFKCDTTRLGRIWDLFDATLTAMFAALYIWNTQYVKVDNKEAFPYTLQLADFVLAATIFVQYLPRIWLDRDPLAYMCNFFSFVTWASVFPVMAAFILTIFDDVMDNTYMGAGILIYAYPLRFVRLHTVLQVVLTPVKSSLFKFSKIMRKGVKLVAAIMITFLTVSAYIHLVTYKQADEDDNIERISFSDAFYFTVLSSTNGMSTDLVPTSAFTRAIILYIMFLGALYLPTALSELLTLIQEKSKYDRSYKGEKQYAHIIVTGDFDSTTLFEFLREFFCVDHGLATMNTYVVIMHPDEPTEEIVEFLEEPAFVTRVQYVKGSPTMRRSLEKIQADTASAAFLLTKKFSDTRDEDDASQMMRALAIKKFNRSISLYAQINLPENAPHFDFLAKDVICIDEISMGLVAQSLVIPGFTSLVVLLTTSVTDNTVHNLIQRARKKQSSSWVEEYIHGIKHEIYAITFPEHFIGSTFLECSRLIYERFGAALFSIGIYRMTKGCFEYSQLGSNTSPFQIFVNPQDYKIQGDEIGFVICDNAEITVKLSRFNYHPKHWYDPLEKLAHHLLGKDRDTHSRGIKPLDVNPHTEVEVEVDSDSEVVPLCNSKSNEEIVNQNLQRAAESCNYEEFEMEDVKDHIIICNPSKAFPENLDIFLSVLRERHSSCRDLPVVILSNESPSDSDKRILQKFGKIHFIEGSPLRRKDLYRARVNFAKKCVVLSDATGNSDKLDGTGDASSLMIALNIESLTNNCHVLVECINRETFKMIGESNSIKNNEEEYIQAIMRPSFMAGNVFTPCNLDTMLCQCFYNRHISVIMKRLIFSHDQDDDMVSPKIERQLNNEMRNLGIASGHMFYVDAPKRFAGQSYNVIYSYLTKVHKAIPLGLYRSVSHKNEPHNYIYLNPKRDTIIKECDKIYLISSKLPDFINDNSEIPISEEN